MTTRGSNIAKMDMFIRCEMDDEMFIDDWLMCGVPDGCDYDEFDEFTSKDYDDFYSEFKSLMDDYDNTYPNERIWEKWENISYSESEMKRYYR